MLELNTRKETFYVAGIWEEVLRTSLSLLWGYKFIARIT